MLVLSLLSCTKALENADFIPAPGQDKDSSDGPSTEPEVVAPEQLKVMSFNVRTASADLDHPTHNWDYRRKAVPPMMTKENASLIGVQEALLGQVQYIAETMPRYQWYGVGRDTGSATSVSDEMTAIFWDPSILDILDRGTFWMNETGRVGEKGWDENYVRISSWALFRHKATGKCFFYLNTHAALANVAKVQNILLIVRKVQELNPDGYPVVMTGDWNASARHAMFDPFVNLYYNARSEARSTDNYSTMNGWGENSSTIDHIFYRDMNIKRYKTVRDRYEGVTYISDHYPVYALFEFKN